MNTDKDLAREIGRGLVATLKRGASTRKAAADYPLGTTNQGSHPAALGRITSAAKAGHNLPTTMYR